MLGDTMQAATESDAALREELALGLQALRLPPLPEDSAATLIAHLHLVEKWNRTHNLTAARTLEELLQRHTLDSLSLLPYLPERGAVADLGSGAGFPGLVLAIARADLRFSLIEAQQKKASFLLQAAHALGLSNVTVSAERAERAEQPQAQPFACITARALAPLAVIAQWAGPLLAPGGSVLAMKAGTLEDELRNLPREWNAERIALPEALARRCVVRMRPATMPGNPESLRTILPQ